MTITVSVKYKTFGHIINHTGIYKLFTAYVKSDIHYFIIDSNANFKFAALSSIFDEIFRSMVLVLIACFNTQSKQTKRIGQVY